MIKMLACIIMVIDHTGLVFFPEIVVLRLIGRLSMPLFAYCIARGFSSANKRGTARQYINRMIIFAAASQIPYMLMVKAVRGNIGVTWLIALLILYLAEKRDKTKTDYFIITILALSASVIPMDYGIYGIGFTVIFYFFNIEHYDRNKFLAGIIILHVWLFTQELSTGIFQIFTLPCILALELLKKHDNKIRINKRFFYMFYPLHMLAFVLINAILINLSA
jgi:hypothetical protein